MESKLVTVEQDDLRALLAQLAHTYLKPSLKPAFDRLVAAAEAE